MLRASVKVPEPKFSSQTKDKLVSSEVRAPVEDIVAKALAEFWKSAPTTPKSCAARSSKPPAPARPPARPAK